MSAAVSGGASAGGRTAPPPNGAPMTPDVPDAARELLAVEVVYVHAPFCARRCGYCDFAVTVERSPSAGPWLSALKGELAALGAEGRVRLAERLDTLYVGGGTPSLLGPEAMAGLARVLGPERLRGDHEWTAEANPESFTAEVAREWRRAGVTRVSLGAQSFQEPVLRWMGRLHGPEGPARAVAHARDAGVADVSIDLIFGLPPALERDWDADLDRALALDVPHLSLYGLTAEPATPLGRSVASGRVAMPPDERYAEEYLRAHERLSAAGYHAYEVSNFARPGHESRHNRAYWEGRPYLGLGNGAHGYLPPERRWNLRDWHAYAVEATAARPPVADRETVTGPEARLEEVWLALRTDRGLPADRLATDAALALTDRWTRAGLARMLERRLVLTPEGWLLLDRLAVELDEALDRAGSDGAAAPRH